MWRRVNNLVNSLITYQTLSPDSRCRRQVSQWLQQRPSLTSEQWFEAFWQAENVLEITTDFVYHAFSSYSGLPFAYVIPEDRLEEDLCWTQVCWFDWEISFFSDVETQFYVDISGHFNYEKNSTVLDIVRFLDHQIRFKKDYSNGEVFHKE